MYAAFPQPHMYLSVIFLVYAKFFISHLTLLCFVLLFQTLTWQLTGQMWRWWWCCCCWLLTCLQDFGGTVQWIISCLHFFVFFNGDQFICTLGKLRQLWPGISWWVFCELVFLRGYTLRYDHYWENVLLCFAGYTWTCLCGSWLSPWRLQRPSAEGSSHHTLCFGTSNREGTSCTQHSLH